jgi:hypothetical protein
MGCKLLTCETIYDFEKSFITFVVKGYSNYGRFKLESVTTVRKGDVEEKFILLSPVMACDVYGKESLFKDPPYLYQALFSNNHYKIFRTYLPGMRQDNNSGCIEELFEGLEKCFMNKEALRLTDNKEIIAATMANRPLTARMTFENINGFNISAEFPIKHINVHPEREVFQVETGTAAFPNITNNAMNKIENFNVLYLAFSSFLQIDMSLFPESNSFRKKCCISLFADKGEDVNVF